jgi:hypothetical protein
MVIQTRAVPLLQAELCASPIFLVGVHRSGTSLCRRIIDSHTHIACPPETHFLTHFATLSQDGPCEAGFGGLGFGNRSEFLQELRRWSSQYHEAYRLAKAKLRWADKTPDYVWVLPQLDEIFGGDARYVMIFRHPLEVVHSIFVRGWRLREYHKELLLNCAYYVADGIKRQLAFARQHSKRCYRLYYEDLVQHPEPVLRAVFEFLGEPWEPRVLAFDEFDHNFGTEDRVMRHFRLNWGGFRALKPEQIKSLISIVRKPAAVLGYSLDDLSVPSVKSALEDQFTFEFDEQLSPKDPIGNTPIRAIRSGHPTVPDSGSLCR